MPNALLYAKLKINLSVLDLNLACEAPPGLSRARQEAKESSDQLQNLNADFYK